MGNDQVSEAVEALKKGGVVVFPTDTVWGVGALISSKEGLRKLYKVKRREGGKPTAVLVSGVEMARKYGVLNEKAEELAEKYWPGGLTVVVGASKLVPRKVLGADGWVGLRTPNHGVALALIKMAGEGIVTASANFAGGNPPKNRREIEPEFEKMVNLVMSGEAGGSDPSTVVRVVAEEIEVLRRGKF